MSDAQDQRTVDSDAERGNSNSGVKTVRSAQGSLIVRRGAIQDDFPELVRRLEEALGIQIWLLVQSRRLGARGVSPFDSLGPAIVREFRRIRSRLPAERIGLLVDSPGGDAKAAYQLAMMLKNQCGRFTAIVPRYAKSAATLLCLGAESILMSDDAEIGPLDVQIIEPDREEQVSALDELQSLDRLSVFAQESVDRHIQMLASRSGMKIRTLLPEVHSFVSSMVRPLFEKIDVVHYTQMSRLLKVAEEYAVRLLQPNQDKLAQAPLAIARRLVHSYPEHGFFIGAGEAKRIGLNVEEPSDEVSDLLRELVLRTSDSVVVGRLEGTL